MEYNSVHFFALLPEITLGVLAILGQGILLFYKQIKHNIYLIFSIILLCVAITLFFIDYPLQQNMLLNNMFFMNNILLKVKAICIFILGIILFVFFHLKLTLKEEFLFILICSSIGSLVLISSKDFMLFFCALELQSLCSYALVSFNKDDIPSSTEAAIKYFVIGAVFTCFMLMGVSFIYGFSGYLNFGKISTFIQTNEMINLGLMLGLFFVLFTLCFKLSAAPFHFWAIDVYLTTDICSLLYFGTITKISLSIALANIVQHFIFHLDNAIYSQIIKIIAVFSMVLGGLLAVNQKFLRKLMAYSTVLNIGYYLIAISIFTYDAQNTAVFFIISYSISFLSFFLCIVGIFGKNIGYLSYKDIIKIGFSHKFFAFLILINILSILAIPPLLGFFMKYNIFASALKNGEITIALVGIIMTIISAYFYLKIIAHMYFIEFYTEDSVNIIKSSIVTDSQQNRTSKFFLYCGASFTTISLILLPLTFFFVGNSSNSMTKFLF